MLLVQILAHGNILLNFFVLFRGFVKASVGIFALSHRAARCDKRFDQVVSQLFDNQKIHLELFRQTLALKQKKVFSYLQN